MYASLPLGRANTDIYSLAFEIVKRGHEVLLFLRRDEYEYRVINVMGKLKIYPIFPSKMIEWIILYPIILIKALIELLRAKPDLIISSKSMVLPILAFISIFIKRPTVIIVRESLAENLLYAESRSQKLIGRILFHVEYELLKLLKKPILAIDEGLLLLMKKNYNVEPKLMRYPVLKSFHRCNDLNEQSLALQFGLTNVTRPIIIYHGRLSKDRNLDFLIKSFCNVMNRCNVNATLIIAGYGDWNYVAKLVKEAPKRCRNRIVILRRWLKYQDIIRLLCLSDISIETFQRRFPENIQLGTKIVDALLTNNFIVLPRDAYYNYLREVITKLNNANGMILYSSQEELEEAIFKLLCKGVIDKRNQGNVHRIRNIFNVDFAYYIILQSLISSRFHKGRERT